MNAVWDDIKSDIFTDTVVWNAVRAGDSKYLNKFAGGGEQIFALGTLMDHKRSTILHHAVMSKNPDVVRWVVDHCKPNMTAQDIDGLTPLMLACELSVAAEIIIYLHQLEMKDEACMKAYDNITPLYYAVYQGRLDLAKQLIANEAKVDDVLLRDTSSPLSIVATVTGDAEMLQCLLDAANVKKALATAKDDGPTMLEVFAERAAYSAEKKVACFEILYNLAYPVPAHDGADRVRYQVEDILKLALLSVCSTSLIPYFVENECKWETREEIRSLYDRLIPDYGILALFVLCECGPAPMERQDVLGTILRDPLIQDLLVSAASNELETMYRNAIVPDGGQQFTTNAKQLLVDFASFTKRIELECLRNALHAGVQAALLTDHLMADKPLMSTREQFTAYQEIIDCMVGMYRNNTMDATVERLLNNESLLTRPDLVFPLLKHCSSLLMWHGTAQDSTQNKPTRLFQFFTHLFGTWKAIKCFSTPQLSVFSLKRLARDTVRVAVWNGIDATVRTTQRGTRFFDRLESLDIPNEMKGYLRYCDYTSVNYFLCHLHDAIEFFRETRRLD